MYVSFIWRFTNARTVAVRHNGICGGSLAQIALAQEPAHQHGAVTTTQPGTRVMTYRQIGARRFRHRVQLPDDTPMYAVHSMKGPWTLMFHENAFLPYLHKSGDRGDDQVGSINWMMGMAERNAWSGRFRFRGMVSLEPWSISLRDPDLLATGEECKGEKIHDRQHPHDLSWNLRRTTPPQSLEMCDGRCMRHRLTSPH